MANVTSPTVIRERLDRIGKTPSDVARELGVPDALVRDVLDGRLKGKHGAAHNIAVALGLKEGVIVPDGMSIVDALKTVAAR